MKKRNQKMQAAMATLVACSLLGDSVVAMAQTEGTLPVQQIEKAQTQMSDQANEVSAMTGEETNDSIVSETPIQATDIVSGNEQPVTNPEQSKSGIEALLINEVYGGGGKAGKNGDPNAPYAYDFIEIYNPTPEQIDLAELKLRYTNNSAGTIQTYTFSAGQVIEAHDYFLLRCESTVGNMGEKGFGEIFNADAFYDIPEKGIGMSDTKGSVQLLTASEVEIDAVNYGKAGNGIGEGNSITGVNHLTSVQRQNFQDTQDNASDFVVGTPTPQKAGGEIEILAVEKIGNLKQNSDYLGKTVSVEATVTAAQIYTQHGMQETLTYVQDASGGIALQNLTSVAATVGQKLMITGTFEQVAGEYRLNVQNAQSLSDVISTHAPAAFTAANAVNNSGWFASVSGKVTALEGNMLIIDDILPVFINESMLRLQAVQLGDFVNVKGVLAVVDEQTHLVAAQPADVVMSQNDFLPTMHVKHVTSYSTGMADEDGGVAEIVKFNADNQKFYLINGKTQAIEIVDMSDFDSKTNTTLSKEAEIQLAPLVSDETFTFGDVTSLDIHTEKKIIVAAIQAADYQQAGKVIVMDYDGNLLESFAVGVQPDMVKITADGRYILTADEAEPREGMTGEGWDPEGSVTIIDYEQKTTSIVKFDDETKIAADVHIRNQDGGARTDLEPEYIALSSDQTQAYVSLQENNAIATINIADGTVASVESLGFKDHTIVGNELDAGRDGIINIEQLPIKGLYMPDAISTVQIKGKDY